MAEHASTARNRNVRDQAEALCLHLEKLCTEVSAMRRKFDPADPNNGAAILNETLRRVEVLVGAASHLLCELWMDLPATYHQNLRERELEERLLHDKDLADRLQ
jgi:hypothetical protein